MVINVEYVDSLAGLAELEFEGVYSCVPWHIPDLHAVLSRAWNHGLSKIIVPGGTLKHTKRVVEIANLFKGLYSAVACHPNLINAYQDQLGPEKYRPKMDQFCRDEKTVAVGCTGLDYSKSTLEDCPEDVQIKYLHMHLEVCKDYNLPILLMCRNAVSDMFAVLKDHPGVRGVIHSFDGTLEDAKQYIELGYHIGITGCSLKLKRNAEVVKSLPLNRVIFGSGSPICSIKKQFPGYEAVRTVLPHTKKQEWSEKFLVHGRNEPVNVRQVVELVAGLRGVKPELVAVLNQVNTYSLFFPSSLSKLRITNQ